MTFLKIKNRAVSIVIVFVFAFLAMFFCFNLAACKDIGQAPCQTADVVDGNDNPLESGYAMPNNIAFLLPTAKSISANDGTTITATVYPANAVGLVNWAVEFVNPAHEWAVDKVATDYVSITPEYDGSLTATVVCLNPFGAQIKIVVRLREDVNIFADCTVDFIKRLSYSELYFNNDNVTLHDGTSAKNIEIKQDVELDFLPTSIVSGFMYFDYTLGSGAICNPVYTVGTVANEVLSYEIYVKVTDSFKDALIAAGMLPFAVTGDGRMAIDWRLVQNPQNLSSLIIALFGGNFNAAAFSFNSANSRWINTALRSTTETDFYIRIVATPNYGEPVVTEYSCHFNHDTLVDI